MSATTARSRSNPQCGSPRSPSSRFLSERSTRSPKWTYDSASPSRTSFKVRNPWFATVKNSETGQTEKIKCQYLVGCDGGGSQVRTCLDIRYDGIARVAQLYMVHFRSDARDVLQPWGIAWHYQTSQATMIAQNDRDIWTLHTFLPPDARLDDIDPSALVHRFAGRPFTSRRWSPIPGTHTCS